MGQTNPANDKYSDTDVPFTLTPFTVDPTFCASRITYTITEVIGPDGSTSYLSKLGTGFDGVLDGDASDGILNLRATPADYLDPATGLPLGTYTFTVTGTTEAGTTQTATFTWTLEDPCGPPNSISIGEFALTEYTITDNRKFVPYAPVTVDPDYCTPAITMNFTPADVVPTVLNIVQV